ncbi:MAG: biopolymer transporter ExbD [Gemmatimonadaceae bacterium]|nr:biopolymer transporter ExbD [Gemmatimonadaceae bacterium]
MRRRRAGRLHLNAEINVVSLIDVMMLLLVIFMITAPLMQGGVDIRLPEADAKPLEDKSSIVISIDRNGRIYVGRDGMSYSEFAGSARTLLRGGLQRGVTIRADRQANVEMLLRVFAVVRNVGITNIGVAAESEPPR